MNDEVTIKTPRMMRLIMTMKTMIMMMMFAMMIMMITITARVHECRPANFRVLFAPREYNF